MAAACVEAAPAAGVARRHVAAQPARKRMRVAMGTTEDYDYEDACRLGEGTFCAVIRARHRGTGRAVAMKFLGEDGGGPAELLRESLLLDAASAGNPFVVGCRGLARDPATADLCLVMDCGGATLRDALRRQPGVRLYTANEVLLGGEAPFQGEDEDDQLSAIFGVLGYPDDAAWPWFWSTQFAAEMPEMDKKRCKTSVLRCKYPETKLSEEGFEVLSGLLTCNPDKRLTAAAALKHPWFSKMDEPEMPKKEVVPPLPKRQRLQ
ncbi:unnamed protein product [Urochloa decumbens]|uniref:[RNA-polymerase]-subunit kinase n=1 Tax=Urochloa decumbens TaxID=240449 RepID=A0ABC8YJ95_9POAL